MEIQHNKYEIRVAVTRTAQIGIRVMSKRQCIPQPMHTEISQFESLVSQIQFWPVGTKFIPIGTFFAPF